MTPFFIKQKSIPSKTALSALLLAGLVGCSADGGDNLNPRAPEEGLYIEVEANLHEDTDELIVVTSLFQDGKALSLTGGDVVKASTSQEEALLTDRHPVYSGYWSTLAVDDQTAQEPIQLEIVHDAQGTREDRWYPTDLALTDPGPGELVGLAGSVSLPSAVSLNDARTEEDPIIFTSREDAPNLLWLSSGNDRDMLLRAAVTCDNELKEQSYMLEFELNDDDGAEPVLLSDVIYDTTEDNPEREELKARGRVMLQTLFNQLSAGGIDPNFFESLADVNPATSNCDIALFVFRQDITNNETDAGKSRLVGSNSAVTYWRYEGLSP